MQQNDAVIIREREREKGERMVPRRRADIRLEERKKERKQNDGAHTERAKKEDNNLVIHLC